MYNLYNTDKYIFSMLLSRCNVNECDVEMWRRYM